MNLKTTSPGFLETRQWPVASQQAKQGLVLHDEGEAGSASLSGETVRRNLKETGAETLSRVGHADLRSAPDVALMVAGHPGLVLALCCC